MLGGGGDRPGKVTANWVEGFSFLLTLRMRECVGGLGSALGLTWALGFRIWVGFGVS